MAGSNSPSTIALISAVLVVVTIFLVTPVLVSMYLDINKTKHVVEHKTKQLDYKIEQLNDLIRKLNE